MRKEDDPFSVMDKLLWRSSVFSREAMSLNHVSSNGFGDRKALGIFRIIATAIMLAITIWLTIYDALVTKTRPMLAFNWWVCIGTFLFFVISLIPVRYYFQEEGPDRSKFYFLDGSNPFHLWKIMTLLNCLMLTAACHLALLVGLRIDR